MICLSVKAHASKCINITLGILVQFSHNQYMANESDGYATVTITLNANYSRRSATSVYLRIFLSSKFQPRAGGYLAKYELK